MIFETDICISEGKENDFFFNWSFCFYNFHTAPELIKVYSFDNLAQYILVGMRGKFSLP